MILFVDDDKLLQEVVVGNLQRHGLEVVTLESGNSAIEWLSSGHECDLIITDIHMNDGTGIELILWKEKEDRNIPVIIITGDELANLHETEQFCEVMHLPVISKPFTTDRLLSELAKYNLV